MNRILSLVAAAALATPWASQATVVTHGQAVALSSLTTSPVSPTAAFESLTTVLETGTAAPDWSTTNSYLGRDSFTYSFEENLLTISLNLAGAAFASLNTALHQQFQVHLSDLAVEFSGITEVSDTFVGSVGGSDGFIARRVDTLYPDGSTRWSNLSFELMLNPSALTAAVREAGMVFSAQYEFGLASLATGSPGTPVIPVNPAPAAVSAPGSVALAGLALLSLMGASRRRTHLTA